MNGMDTACKTSAGTGATAPAGPWSSGIRSLASADPWAEHSKMSGEKHQLSCASPRNSPRPSLLQHRALPLAGSTERGKGAMRGGEPCALDSTVQEPAVENECDKMP